MSVKVNASLTNLAKAQDAWGAAMPEWVAIMAKACDASNQREVARQLEKSGGYVSRIINCSYGGSYDEARQLVMGRLGDGTVRCPVWGDDIRLTACIAYRRAKTPPGNHAERLYARACPTCPNNTDREGAVS
ncbi:hypothetical protein QQS45_00115 [Alteriqipengyuania flavescens]|uniref:hypothetical protein n=1 Tax=Alteriqipengyuania flavescens TaxID=3053610 RepID=UPI0025B4ABC5|nr:hypothetical protein [Alteriqipengyuania flavescens]WJY18694.1 hypothetical protein QQW98_00115 [Alteriqipengyuania flavescens]WJY24634.1 hypothetical protein QQS45_00115 [Alteriqipengyuania flavescens]